jgi:Fe2+ or Zn2+ uptake regulation protein
MKLTMQQRAVLKMISEEPAQGTCIRYVWTFHAQGEPITRQVRALLSAGLVDMITFRGGRAAINITEAGRRHLRS